MLVAAATAIRCMHALLQPAILRYRQIVRLCNDRGEGQQR